MSLPFIFDEEREEIIIIRQNFCYVRKKTHKEKEETRIKSSFFLKSRYSTPHYLSTRFNLNEPYCLFCIFLSRPCFRSSFSYQNSLPFFPLFFFFFFVFVFFRFYIFGKKEEEDEDFQFICRSLVG